MAQRSFMAEILNGEGSPYTGKKVRVVKHSSEGRIAPWGKETVVQANGNIKITLDVPSMTNDEVSLQIFLNKRWQNVQAPMSTGSGKSLILGKIVVLDKTVKVGDRQVHGLNLSNPGEVTRIVKGLQEQKAVLESQTDSLRLEREALKTELTTTTEKLSFAQKDIVELKTQLSVLEEFKQNYDAKKAISLNGLLSTTVIQLKEAQSSASKDNLGFTIGKVTMELKGVPVKGSEEFEFPDKSEIMSMNQNNLSTINVAFEPTPVAVDTETLLEKVPNISKLGERMAVRKLEEKGFVADIHYETTAKDTEVGRVLTQKPPAGQDTEAGSIVDIYVGKLLDTKII